MAVYYAEEIEIKETSKHKSFHAKKVSKIADNFSGDIVVIENDREPEGVSED